MPVKTYLQTAISQVQTAMAEMESQMHSIQQNADNRKKQLQSEIANMEKERGTHMTALGQNQDGGQRTMLEQRLGSLNKQIDDHKAEISRIDSDLGRTQQRKDELHRNLYNAIGELTRLSALPDIG